MIHDPATLMAAAAQEVRNNADGILMLQCKVGEEKGADPTWELQKEVAYVVADFVGAPLEKQEDLSMYCTRAPRRRGKLSWCSRRSH